MSGRYSPGVERAIAGLATRADNAENQARNAAAVAAQHARQRDAAMAERDVWSNAASRIEAEKWKVEEKLEELLGAAIAALECIEKHVPDTTFAPRDRLRAAIAKARG